MRLGLTRSVPGARYVRREARGYDAFLERKVAIARDERDLGLGSLNDEVEATFAARRAALLGDTAEG